MKINRAVDFSDISKRELSEYLLNAGKSPEWDAPEIEGVKKEAKEFYKTEQAFRCVYCGQKIVVQHNSNWDLEHIIPRSLAPQFMFTPKNLCVACKDCNTYKGAKKVTTGGMSTSTYPGADKFVIVHPHYDHYRDHIERPSECVYLARTEKGQKTIEICGLARFFRLSLGVKEEGNLVDLINEFREVLSRPMSERETKLQIECFKLRVQMLDKMQ